MGRSLLQEVPKSGEISLYMDIIVDLSLGGDIFLNLQRFFYHKRTGLLITDQCVRPCTEVLKFYLRSLL